MSNPNWKALSALTQKARRSAARRKKAAASVRLGVEQVEERAVPSGTPLDLTAHGAIGEINGAIFQQYDARPTGTGHINSFVRLQAPNAKVAMQQGYNTDARPLQYNENKSPQFTRSLRLDDLPQVNIGGVLYREFLLDINQKSSQPYLSLDELRLYLGPVANMTGYDEREGVKTLGGYQALYDLDAGGQDNWVKLDYRLNTGSGSGDMLLFIPESCFVNHSENPYVYLYSKFGVNFTGNAGFEEWAAGSGLTAVGSISGYKFGDVDGNGIWDAGEQGLEGWVIYLETDGVDGIGDGEVYTTTDVNGYYEFRNLASGLGEYSTYRVREWITDLQIQDGWVQTTANPVDIILALGEDVTNVNFGNRDQDGSGGSLPPE
jgi:hypothetical protein